TAPSHGGSDRSPPHRGGGAGGAPSGSGRRSGGRVARVGGPGSRGAPVRGAQRAPAAGVGRAEPVGAVSRGEPAHEPRSPVGYPGGHHVPVRGRGPGPPDPRRGGAAAGGQDRGDGVRGAGQPGAAVEGELIRRGQDAASPLKGGAAR